MRRIERREIFRPAFGTDAMAEVGLGIGRNVDLHALPIAGVVSDFFAI